jgi:VanZ family protein
MGFKKREIFYWSLFSSYGLFILLTLPYIVPFQRAIGKKLQSGLIPFVITSITLIFLMLVGYIFFIKKERKITRYIGIFLGSFLILLSVDILILRTSYPSSSKVVEFIHFFEYGLLTFFAYLALKQRVQTRLIYAWGVLLISLFGFVDETIQWIIPSRTGELKDALTNVVCAVTFQIFISQVIKPTTEFKKICCENYKALLKGIAALFFVVTIFVFFVNTGFLIFDEKIGYFISKFPKEDLLLLKKEGEKVIKTSEKMILTEPVVEKPKYWCIDDFYAEEAKFHIRTRNDLLKKNHFREGYSEQKILEKYYLPVLEGLNQNLPVNKVKEILYKIPDKQNRYFYRSPIRENMMTGGTKVAVLFLLIILSIVPLILDIVTDK